MANLVSFIYSSEKPTQTHNRLYITNVVILLKMSILTNNIFVSEYVRSTMEYFKNVSDYLVTLYFGMLPFRKEDREKEELYVYMV